jgi:glycerol uptake facilitator-like aquaporin
VNRALAVKIADSARAGRRYAPAPTRRRDDVTIGLCLTLIHLISIPMTNTPVNPARSSGPGRLIGGEALGQLRVFRVAPIVRIA